MTRADAAAVLGRLAVGLTPDEAGAARLLERIAAAEDPEGLRSALMEHGAAALLEQRDRP